MSIFKNFDTEELHFAISDFETGIEERNKLIQSTKDFQKRNQLIQRNKSEQQSLIAAKKELSTRKN